MRNSRPCLLFFMIFMVIDVLAQVGFEQYVYLNDKKMMALVPIFSYEARNHTYVEARYNYEEHKTFSLYLGRVFSGEDKLSYWVTPMLGGVIGKFKGGSAGVNAVVEYKKIFFSTQSQYTHSFQELNPDFFFAWSDLGYQPWEWFYVGLSAQQTYLPQTMCLLVETGVVLGFTAGKWTFPAYYFSPISDNQYFVLGINYSVGAFKRNR
jgi:hypothetical protein